MRQRPTPARQFQIYYTPIIGCIPAIGLGYVLTQVPLEPPDSTLPASVSAVLGTAIIAATLAGATVLFWAPRRWPLIRLAVTIALGAVIGACLLAATTLTSASNEAILLFPFLGVVVTLIGVSSTLVPPAATTLQQDHAAPRDHAHRR